jgi:hypothetical protein
VSGVTSLTADPMILMSVIANPFSMHKTSSAYGSHVVGVLITQRRQIVE